MQIGRNEPDPLRATLIVPTYENPHALALVLAGLERQTTRAFEMIVADDGSGSETRALVEAFASKAPFPVRHLWQPDEGVRKGRVLNRALLAARAEYAILLDGDCIPPPDLVASHLALARPRHYLSGGKMLLGAEISRRLTPAEVRSGLLDTLGPWRRETRRWRRAAVRRVPALAALLDRLARRPIGFHGENSSLFVDDARAIGGFDERFERLEDKDFGRRLHASGVNGESVRYRIPVWHVDHARPYAGPDVRQAARALFEESAGHVVTEHGLARLKREDEALREAERGRSR